MLIPITIWNQIKCVSMHEAHYNKHLLVALIVRTRSELIIFKITIQLGIKHGFRFRIIFVCFNDKWRQKHFIQYGCCYCGFFLRWLRFNLRVSIIKLMCPDSIKQQPPHVFHFIFLNFVNLLTDFNAPQIKINLNIATCSVIVITCKCYLK